MPSAVGKKLPTIKKGKKKFVRHNKRPFFDLPGWMAFRTRRCHKVRSDLIVNLISSADFGAQGEAQLRIAEG